MAGQWRAAWIPFAGVALAAGEFDGIVLQAGVAGDQAAVLLDDIVLEAGEPPVPQALQVSVDTGGARRAVSPEIYRVNFGSDAQHAALRYPFRRWGGNHTSRYNFQSDTDNRAGTGSSSTSGRAAAPIFRTIPPPASSSPPPPRTVARRW